MWLYPLPAVIAMAMWLYVFFSSPLEGRLFAAAFFVVAILAFLAFRRGARAAPLGA
jgi:hypothetical protein